MTGWFLFGVCVGCVLMFVVIAYGLGRVAFDAWMEAGINQILSAED